MSRKRVKGMTMLKIEEYLKEISESEDIETSDVVILPPDDLVQIF